MAILENVEVKIVSVSTGERFQKYDDPNPEATADDEEADDEVMKKYIEATSGTEFAIHFTLQKGFCYHEADGILIGVIMDGDALRRIYPRPMPSYVFASSRLPVDVVEVVSSSIIQSGEELRRMNFGFGEVTVDEDLHFDATVLQDKRKTLSSIRIVVCRAVNTVLEKPQPYKGAKVTTSSDLDKKLIVKLISHTFKLGTEQIIEEPLLHRYFWNPMKGQHSAAIHYNFFYRSYRALQYLGCIPETPEPVPLSDRHPADMTDEEKASQIIDLHTENKGLCDEIKRLVQAKQTLIEEIGELRDLNTKITALQAALGNIGTIPTLNSNVSAVKMERVKQEPAEECGTSSRPSKRMKPEYVTLDD